jgi:bacterioferritin
LLFGCAWQAQEGCTQRFVSVTISLPDIGIKLLIILPHQPGGVHQLFTPPKSALPCRGTGLPFYSIFPMSLSLIPYSCIALRTLNSPNWRTGKVREVTQLKSKPAVKKATPFVTDIEEIRRRARSHMERGAVTEGYKADRETVVEILNQALATELVCVLRYKRHHYMATGIHSQAVAEEFLEHAKEEQEHADQIAERITQLDGAPDYNPEGLLTRSHSQYSEGTDLVDMLKEDLIAERIAIDSYSEIVRYLGNDDPTSRRMMEEILAKEEEHADDMKTLLETIEKLK